MNTTAHKYRFCVLNHQARWITSPSATLAFLWVCVSMWPCVRAAALLFMSAVVYAGSTPSWRTTTSVGLICSTMGGTFSAQCAEQSFITLNLTRRTVHYWFLLPVESTSVYLFLPVSSLFANWLLSVALYLIFKDFTSLYLSSHLTLGKKVNKCISKKWTTPLMSGPHFHLHFALSFLQLFLQWLKTVNMKI